jgi:hypothetical protein
VPYAFLGLKIARKIDLLMRRSLLPILIVCAYFVRFWLSGCGEVFVGINTLRHSEVAWRPDPCVLSF